MAPELRAVREALERMPGGYLARMRRDVLVAERYRVGDPLGRGGMGEVFRATDELLGREVAIKLLLPARREPEMAERFHREARAAASLSDPHVVAAYDFGPYEDGFFLVMELVEGRTIAVELRRSGPFGPERALDVIRQSAAGLAAAHHNDIVHRDVKPQNLLITPDGTVKVTDFGIARFLTDTTTTLTATGQILGSIHYLAPERAQGLPAGKASDVYALGCVLYQLVTGHPPFQGDQPAVVMYQQVSTEPTPPSDLRPQLAGEFEALLMSMLAKNPDDRPTAAQVAAGTTPHSVATARLADGPVSRGHATPRPGGATASQRSRRRLIGAGAAVAVLAGVGAGVVLDNRDRRLPETTNLTPPSTQRSTPTAPTATAKPTATRPPVTTTVSTERRVSTTGKPATNPPKTTIPPGPPKPGKPEQPGKPDNPGQGKSNGKGPKKP
ncbi:serine/threonine-protein kinase [Kribbella sp. DT2]|uniref:serine/threonine-protein kinase n=1 Tax=Kribbella sp. DT2 TaxID=3393427 RepID=UPI003CEF9360